MYKILKKEKIAENTFLMEIEAQDVARHSRPGQFLMVRLKQGGERIPLTIADFDKRKVTIVFIVSGKTTNELSKLKRGNYILDVAGPLGTPSNIMDKKYVCLIGGGVGIAAIFPIAREYSSRGVRVHCILGVRSKKFLFWKDRFEKFSDKVIVTSDDGSVGERGNVVDALSKLYAKNKYDLVVAIGPIIMMKFVAKYTYQRVKTIVSLNTMMVDGIGMCGGCRIRYDGEVKFTCVDGPEFDAHLVNFDEVLDKNQAFKQDEEHVCKINKIKLPSRK